MSRRRYPAARASGIVDGTLGRVVVAGASVAGLAAAETLRRSGHRGSITLVDSEPGPGYDRPPLSKELLSGALAPDGIALRSAAERGALELDTRYGSAAVGVHLDSSILALFDGSEVPYDGLVIATGVRPRTLPGVPALVLRTLDDAMVLKDRIVPGLKLVVVGAGFLGAEVAASAVALGADVTVLEPAAVPLAHVVGEVVGGMLAEVHRGHGVDLRTGVAVAEIVADGVRLDDGTVVKADAVVVAIGSLPNTEWLAGSGLAVDNGVVCDEFCAAAPGVYAAGDVARWNNQLFGASMRVEHRTNAAEQGMAAARNLLGAGRAFSPVPYFWSDQYDLKLKAYGYLPGFDEVQIVAGSVEERRFTAVYRRGNHLCGVLSLGMPPSSLRPWQKAIASRIPWLESVPHTSHRALSEGSTGATNTVNTSPRAVAARVTTSIDG